MPREIFTTNYTEIEFKELIKSIITEAVREEIDRVLEREQKVPPHKELLTRRETAEYLGITLTTLHKRMNEGSLAPRRIGRKVFFKWDDIQKVLRTFEEKKADRFKVK